MADHGCDELDRLMATLRVNLPGATDPLIKMTLFDAIDAHLRRTNAWRYETDVQLYPRQTQYDIYPPAETALVRVMFIRKGDRMLQPMTTGGTTVATKGRLTPDFTLDPDGYGYNWDKSQNEGEILRYSIYYPTYIEVDIPPSVEAVAVPMQAVLAITLGSQCRCTEADDGCAWALDPWMYDRYYDDWLWGCLSRMMAMAAKPWSNPQMAIMYGKMARSKQNFAKQEADRGFVHDAPNWRFPVNGWVRR
jgi:hypothetical protein